MGLTNRGWANTGDMKRDSMYKNIIPLYTSKEDTSRGGPIRKMAYISLVNW